MPAFRIALALAAGLPLSAAAQDVDAAIKGYFGDHIAPWIDDAAVVGAVTAQNETTHGYDQAMIDDLEATWRSEVGAANQPTIDPVVTSPLADQLRAHIAESGGVITEIFITDGVGLNVAASGITSDMWQGDEAKWQETYGAGPGAMHVSEIEMDESTGSYQAQISATIVDPDSGAAIGAITVGLNAESFM
ncbi:hypothetical protein [Wenxinia saemankumensis]|uniref:Uncharacterized protein n=1 Tax=Wenxinia saemankumensis TaxID=1447782 RepID=A0A1M6HRQ5_9RHOB|nr:hypothetical protein [Wenxinia saemankumensis]SHJ24876.1 hypothetical protein SAMN05444417_3318 [Wenxinia saemankumensis]